MEEKGDSAWGGEGMEGFPFGFVCEVCGNERKKNFCRARN